MRLLEKSTLVVSEDTSSDPKNIRFSEVVDMTDDTLLPESLVRQETYPVGTHVISLGNIAEARYLFIKPSANITIEVNGSPISLRANKTFRGWITFTSLSLIVAGQPAQIVLFVGGN